MAESQGRKEGRSTRSKRGSSKARSARSPNGDEAAGRDRDGAAAGLEPGGEMPTARMEGDAPSGAEEGAGGMPGSDAMSEQAEPPQGEKGEMYSGQSGTQMPGSGAGGGSGGDDGRQRVLVELRVPRGAGEQFALEKAAGPDLPELEADTSYAPVPISAQDEDDVAASGEAAEEVVVVRGTIDAAQREQLEGRPEVVRVLTDVEIAPFEVVEVEREAVEEEVAAAPIACPIPPCDCQPAVAKGTIGQVANYLGVDQIWTAGSRGDGVVVAVVDGGITAAGRPVKSGETARRIQRVVMGWPTADWGTEASAWGEHGNMCSTDVLGMAPNAQIADIRIAGAGIAPTISNALAGFQWALNQYRSTGQPKVISNSWGIFQRAWDPVYASDPTHPFTRKVVEAIAEGMIVLFAAGNCGGTCPDGRCASDVGPGTSIWGANGHPRSITVGAVNRLEQYIGYSSQGPAALDPRKPDFCSISHFQGYFGSDSGTSAATPVAAGVAALMKQARPSLTQAEAKAALMGTAKDIGAAGWDQFSGAGIIRAKAAYDRVAAPPAWRPWTSLGGVCLRGSGAASWAADRLDAFVIGTDSAMWHKYWDGGAWHGWYSQGGVCLSAPAAVSWSPDRIDTFVIGTDHAMWHKYWDGGAWQGWFSQGGVCFQGVAAASWAPNRLDAFVIGSDSAVWHKSWTGSAWTGWTSLGGVCMSAPAAVSWGPNRIDLFVIGTDRAVWHKSWTGSAWTGWTSLGGVCDFGVAAASWASNRLDVFVVGTDSALFHKAWDGVSWSGWNRLGGVCVSQPSAVSWSPNRIDAFVIGTDSALWQRTWS
jgi:serine protease AprX